MNDLTDEPVRIEVDASPVLSYAMALAGIAACSRIRLTATRDLAGVRIDVRVVDPEGRLTKSCERFADLRQGEVTTLSDIPLHGDPAALLQVDENRPAELVVVVTADGHQLSRRVTPIHLLAATHWLARPPGLAMELLAAHVLPNDPAISDLLVSASEALARRTGNGALDGYQSQRPERADDIARAIFEAVQARQVRYAEPPSSWGASGQKVRTPTEVLERGLGTCLDTSVTMAAAYEQAGLHPMLWLIEGHAFVGYFRTDASSGAAHTEGDDIAALVNAVDADLVGVIETTLATMRDVPADVEEAMAAARLRLRGDLSHVLGVTNVIEARKLGILPLPARRRTADGTVQVFEYRPPSVAAAPEAQRRSVNPSPRDGFDAVPPRVQRWKNSLLDLSRRNRLINFSDRARLPLHVPDGMLGVVEDSLHEGKPITLVPSDVLDEVQAARGARSAWDLPHEALRAVFADKRALFVAVTDAAYQTRMRGIAYRARTITEETGANNLYLALGSLLWNPDKETGASKEKDELRSPLILVPVKLVSRGRSTRYRLELDESGGSTPNFCLLEKLKQTHGVVVPGLAEPNEDGAGIDLDAALNAMRVAIAEAGLPYRVEPTADLAILQFAKFRLWKDLDEHWQALTRNPLVKHLVETPTDPFPEPSPRSAEAPDLDALAAGCPLPADASQLHAVADAVAGRTFVLEGPPGTGKSQTITNLLARAVADGRRVLFVAEKRAALDVVRRRLDDVGMGKFCLDLHDKSSKPAVVRTQIKAALEHQVHVDQQGHAALAETLRAAGGTLARYADQLHEPNPVGLSLYSAHTQQLALGPGPQLPVSRRALSVLGRDERLSSIVRLLRTLPEIAGRARPAPHHPWGFLHIDDPARLDAAALLAAVASVDQGVDALPARGTIVGPLTAAVVAEDLLTLGHLARAGAQPLALLDATRGSTWQSARAALVHEVQLFVAAAHPGLDVATPSALDLPLADIHAQAQAAQASSWWGRGKRLKAVLARLSPALRPGAKVSAKHVPALAAGLLQLQSAVHALSARAGGVTGASLSPGWNPLTAEGRQALESQLSWLEWAGRQVDSAEAPAGRQSFVAAVRRYLEGPRDTSAAEAESVIRLGAAAQVLFTLAGASQDDVRAWCDETGLLRRWTETRPRREADSDATGARRWVELLAHVAPLAGADLGEARQHLLDGRVAADDAVMALDRGLATASISERLEATGLSSFDPVSHHRAIERFSESSAGVRTHLRSALPAQVLRSRGIDPRTALGQVGGLQREIGRQRGGMGVRKLLETYGDLITQVMPCVLVSPDSLARFLPADQQLFDLVVFDEASQIRVADAVGAMGRGRAVVVVGDTKQMPPTAVAEVSLMSEDDDILGDDLVEQDQESILEECRDARVPARMLTWHYRSQDESLIAFSNQHYYDGRLSSFPAPTTGRADAGIGGRGISLVPVAGTFLRTGKGKLLRTNPQEAEAVVAELRRRFESSPSEVPSVGVVTFNLQQRAYIEGLIRDSGDTRMVEALDRNDGEGLFVKNLENVQGDERDVILFSTAFSVNDKGVLPLNFGPLTRVGGERRLNVAVTRARRQVVIFSSFAPSQLRADETTSKGIKHLRSYLDVASGDYSALMPRERREDRLDRHVRDLAAALRAAGLVVHENLGLSDFKVELGLALPEAPEDLLVAVLLDGEGWRRRETVADRDGLPIDVLSSLLKWPAVERVWLPDWLQSREATTQKLSTAVRRAADATEAGPAEGVNEVAPEPFAIDDTDSPFAGLWSPGDSVVLDDALADTGGQGAVALANSINARSLIGEEASPALPGEQPYVPWMVRSAGPRDVLDALPRTAKRVRSVIEDVVACEGPIHHERLAKLVGSAFGLSRVASSRAASVLALLPSSMAGDRGEPFAWPPELDHRSWKGFRRAAEGTARPIEYIPLREMANAMVALAGTAYGIREDELLRETLLLFGGKALTQGTRSRLDEGLRSAIAAGRLAEREGLIVVAER